MEQWNLGSDSSVKIVKVEITRRYDMKSILTYRESGTEEEIKKNISEYLEKVKKILGIEEYKFLSFEIEK